jgi:hypothetical protein
MGTPPQRSYGQSVQNRCIFLYVCHGRLRTSQVVMETTGHDNEYLTQT